MSRNKIISRLKKLHRQRDTLIQALLDDSELAVGSVSAVKRKCGKPNCHCADGDGHMQLLFMSNNEEGRRRCQLIRKKDEDRWLVAGERYRKFRKALRDLEATNRGEKTILMALRDLRSITYN